MIAIYTTPFFSAGIMIWVLLITLFVSILAAIFIRPTTFQQSRIGVFFSILASLTVLFIGLNVLVSTFTFERQQVYNVTNTTKQSIDKLWLYPNQLLTTSKNARPEFLKSFYPNNVNLFLLPTINQSPTVFSILEEQNISIVFIQAWEDYLTIHELDQTGESIWLNNFLQWAQNPFFEEYFNFLKYNFKETTIELGKLLFEYAKTLPKPTMNPEIYRLTVRKMVEDPRVVSLFKRSNLENQGN